MRTRNPELHAARRQRIINAAAHLFATNGFEGTSTAQICAAAGISSGNLFHYFRSKREVFVATVTDDGKATAAALATAREMSDPVQGLLTFVTHLTEAATDPLVPRLVLEAMLLAHRDPELDVLLDRDIDAERLGLLALLDQFETPGKTLLGTVTTNLATWIMTMVAGLYVQAATIPDFDTVTQRALLLHTVRLLVTVEGTTHAEPTPT